MTKGGVIHPLGPWLGVSVAVAVVATAFDAMLLHRRRSYFTGGFLSVDHISGWPDALAFFAGSLVSDAAVLTILTGVALWACVRLGLSARDSQVMAFLLSLAPVFTMDFVSYRLESFLGDAFDFRLMFELAGRNPAEILAVSSSQAIVAMAILLGGAGGLVAILWMLRLVRGRLGDMPLPTLRQGAWTCVALLVTGTVTTTVLRSSSDTLDNGLRRKPTGQVLGALVSLVSDVDRDGYGLLGRLRDPDVFDSAVHPHAVDVPGNGIDEDGVAGDLPLDAPYTEASGRVAPWPQRPSVVVIALESFRADAVGASVNGMDVTPVLDALSRAGVSSPSAYSHNGYTVQSRHHIFSGSLAGIRKGTIVDDFKAQGYETAYFSGQDESFGGPQWDVGFDRADVSYDARQDQNRRYSTFSTAGSLAVPFGVVLERVGAFLDSRSTDRPLFLYVNFHDTHFPYHHASIAPLLGTPVLAPSNIVPGNAKALLEMYLNTAANVDRAIGTLQAHVRRTLRAEPGIVVLADHGESLFDEGFLGHGYALNDAQTRIPLIVSNLAAEVVEPFGQSDLRSLLSDAMSKPPGGSPSRRASPGRSVFQYLGSLEAPSQISTASPPARIIYDFRTLQVQIDGGAWQRPDDLDATDTRRFQALIQAWERMRLAQAVAARSGS